MLQRSALIDPERSGGTSQQSAVRSLSSNGYGKRPSHLRSRTSIFVAFGSGNYSDSADSQFTRNEVEEGCLGKSGLVPGRAWRFACAGWRDRSGGYSRYRRPSWF